MSAKEHLQGERFYLHPGGLSKSRRKIFESWILKEGGEMVTMAEEGVVALVEDKLLEGQTLETAIAKIDSKVMVVGLSWLSSCIEQNKRLSEATYILRRSNQVGGQKKRRAHDLSDSDDSEPEQPESKHVKEVEDKQRHQMSDSDEEEEETPTNDVKRTAPDLNNISDLDKSSAPSNASIAIELGLLRASSNFICVLVSFAKQKVSYITTCREAGEGLQREWGPMASKDIFEGGENHHCPQHPDHH